MAFLVFASKSVADTITNEIAATPAVEGGIGPVWVWFHPEHEDNTISYAQSGDGRVAMAHGWSEVDVDWLNTYCAEWIAAGTMQVLDAMPTDWAPPVAGIALYGEITFTPG